MMCRFRTVFSVLGTISALLLSPLAQAITIPLEGTVTNATPNPNAILNVAIGDSVAGATTFDENLIIADPNAIITPADGMTLEITIGDVTFHEIDDFGFPFFPELTFTGGSLTNIDMIVLFDYAGGTVDPLGSAFSFDLLNGVFFIRDNTFQEIVGGTISAVPEPSTLFLAMSGLMGLAGLGRKRLPKRGRQEHPKLRTMS